MKDSALFLAVCSTAAFGSLTFGILITSENAHANTDTPALEAVVVTATGEKKLKREVAESIQATEFEEIERISPAHPAQVLNRTAGVHINNLGGEGHMTSIRQPITTGGVYLFLENGIPTRPTGLFNHNALYQ